MGESNKDSGVIQVRQNASRNKGYFIYHGQTLLETRRGWRVWNASVRSCKYD